MTVFTSIRRNHHSGQVLGGALLALFVILIAPCAMAPAANDVGVIDEKDISVQTKCLHAEPTPSMTAVECCCDISDVLIIKAPELSKLPLFVAIPSEPNVSLMLPGRETLINSQRPPLHETSPPVYLATQRLRI